MGAADDQDLLGTGCHQAAGGVQGPPRRQARRRGASVARASHARSRARGAQGGADDCIAIVSPERDTVPPEISVLEDPGHGLNAALDAARQMLVDQGASELVVLPADLPVVTAAEIDALVESGRRTGFALATDVAGTSTNALYLAAPAAFRFHFGPGSRRHHIEEAMRLGLKPQLVRARGLEFDLDVVEDLARLQACADPRYASLPLFSDGGPWLPQTRLG